MNKKIIPAFSILFLLYVQSFSQGCSDAGFCTMGSLKSSMADGTPYKHRVKLLFGFGSGEQKTKHVDVIPEFEFSFFEYNVLQIKVPFLVVDGNLGSNNGLGDVSISTSQAFLVTDQSQLGVTIGAKLPTGTTNAKALPMPYQTGLGTVDLILGVSYQYNKWKFSTGYQKILSDGNKNHFLHTTNSTEQELKYFESNLLARGDDALIRVDRSFNPGKIKLTAGLLSIFRLQKDRITNEMNQQVALEGSDGLTLNVTGGAEFLLSDQSGVNLLFGMPAVVRDVRADGLTRKFVFFASYHFRFGKK